MKYLLVQAAMALVCLSAQPSPGEELVPGLLLMDAISLPSGNLAIGMNFPDVLGVLGAGWKYRDKPKRYTSEKLTSEAETVQRLMPMYPASVRKAQQLAVDCGRECWISMVEKPLGRRDVLRIVFIGKVKTEQRVHYMVFDQGGSAIRRWRRSTMRDLRQEATYFVTDDGTYRVLREGNLFRIEEIR